MQDIVVIYYLEVDCDCQTKLPTTYSYLLYSVSTLSQLPPSLKDSRSGDVELKVLGFNPRPHLEDYVINSDMIKG